MATILVLILFADWVNASPMVNMPSHYIAMKGSIVVDFSLDGLQTSNWTLESFNAMVHIEYLPGNSILTNHHRHSTAMLLARHVNKQGYI